MFLRYQPGFINIEHFKLVSYVAAGIMQHTYIILATPPIDQSCQVATKTNLLHPELQCIDI